MKSLTVTFKEMPDSRNFNMKTTGSADLSRWEAIGLLQFAIYSLTKQDPFESQHSKAKGKKR